MSTVVFSPTARPPRSRRAVVALVRLVVWACFGFAVVFGTFVSAPGVLGFNSFSVLSGSMEPTLMVGDIVVNRRIHPADVRPGDIITFRDPDKPARLLTHRVVQYRVEDSRAFIVTKGDANHGVERWRIPLSGGLGRVEFRIPKIGYLVTRMGGRYGKLALIAVPALLLGLFELKRLWLPKERHG